MIVYIDVPESPVNEEIGELTVNTNIHFIKINTLSYLS